MITIITAENAAEFNCTLNEAGEIVVPKQSVDETTKVDECKGSKEGLVLKGRINRTNKSGETRYNVNVGVDAVVPWEVCADIVMRKVMYDINENDTALETVDSSFRSFVKTERKGPGAQGPLEGEDLEKAKMAAERFGFELPEGVTAARLKTLVTKAVLASM